MMQPCAPIRAGRVAIAALLALASLAAPAQTTPRKATGSYRIAGRVVNASTGEPVPRATVSALAEEDNHIVQSVQADAEGRFSLVRLAAGKYPLNASKRGYRTAFYDEHDDFNSAIVTGEGQDTENLVFKLTPGAVLRGVVTGDGGDPVEGANVMLYQRQHASGRVVQVEGTTTDDTGTY
jgi:5-hydroxyisourate hydrolase-like protein (transthyretin family)